MFVAAGAFLLLAILILILGKCSFRSEKSDNLALKKGVKATCDSMETEALSADKAIDGDDETLSSRWSSENNWEDASHYIELEFPEEISVSFVVLKWERTNVISYRLEGSLDGEDWQELASFGQAPMTKRQEIPLSEAVNVRFLRLSTDAVSQTEEDYSNLYQNVSLYEFEVYEDKPVAYTLDAPTIGMRENGTRYLALPEAPEGYQITYLGADYEQIIGADCEVYDTIQDKEVTVGLLVEQAEGADREKGKEDAEEVSFTIMVPASESSVQAEGEMKAAETGNWENTSEINRTPQVVPVIAEWSGGEGVFIPGADSRIFISEEKLRQTAELFAGRYQDITGYEVPVQVGKPEDVRAGDFFLSFADTEEGIVRGIGEEGYVCEISDKCVITGTHTQGIYWGTITVLQILKGQESTATHEGAQSAEAPKTCVLPQGRIRDYPKYSVRGFGIDVARKPVSMPMLYQIMENMSWYKMNDLCIHLNDNVILSTSGLTESVESAMGAESAFRLALDIVNDKGEQLTAQDYAYTAEEFAEFVRIAEGYGVQVVPEIDTPAHSLSITKLFPEYALKVQNEAVDQIDLSKKGAVELVKEIWGKAFDVAFSEASVVNIGMDEYYGDGETYRQYMNEIIGWVKEEGGVETVRLWGSLNNMDGVTMPETSGLQMNIWSTIWADPLDMYGQGYSLINMQNNHLYIIPGGGYDYLDTEELFRNWEVNKFYDYNQLELIPSYSPQMLGASYMIWNDMCGNLDVGLSEYDLFDRFFAPLGIISSKLWGEGSECSERDFSNGDSDYDIQELYKELQVLFKKSGTAPGTNPYAEAEWEGDSLDYFSGEELLTLKGGADYVETGYRGGNGNGCGIGGTYTVSMQVYKEIGNPGENGDVSEEILFETDSAYGQTAFKAVQTGTGQVGFSREGKDYSFDYTLPEGEWITLTICGQKNQTSLYVNGELVDTLGNAEPFEEYATFIFPLERIGSETHGFCGMVKEIKVTAR